MQHTSLLSFIYSSLLVSPNTNLPISLTSLSRYFEPLELILDGPENFRVRFGLNLPRFCAGRGVGLGVGARLALGAVGGVGRVDGFAFLALVVGDAVWSELIAGVSERILVLLGPVSDELV
jgi:hypothetical protein